MAENKYLIKNPVLVDGMVNLYSFNVDSVDYYLVPSSASEDIWCIGFIANIPTSGHPIVVDGTPLAQPIVLSNIRGDVNVYCDHNVLGHSGNSLTSELIYNGKTYYYSTENLYPMGFDTSAIINNIIPIHTEESFSDYESAALKLIELYKAEGGLMPGEKNEEPSEYPTSWIKKQINGNYQKSFTYAHAKTVYTDYANKKTLADKLSEIDTEIGNKANKTEIPTELPANGGNSATVNGHTVKSDVPENAVFTDTVYDDTDVKEEISEINSNLTSEISRAKETEETLKSRVDNLTSLPEGSTTGDAELQDIRVKADGTTATSAGNAVREQVSELKSDLINFIDPNTTKIINLIDAQNLIFNKTLYHVEGESTPHSLYDEDGTAVCLNLIRVKSGDVVYCGDNLENHRYSLYVYDRYMTLKERIDQTEIYNVTSDGFVMINIWGCRSSIDAINYKTYLNVNKRYGYYDFGITKNDLLNNEYENYNEIPFIRQNGYYSDNTFYENPLYISGKIPCNPFEKFKVECYLLGISNFSVATFLDIDGKIIGRTETISTDTHIYNYNVETPSRCRYIIVNSRKDKGVRLKVSKNIPRAGIDFSNLKGGFTGDSICYGLAYEGGYAKILNEKYGLRYNNIGVSGGHIAKDRDDVFIISDSINSLDDDIDFLVMEGGINDYSNYVPVGELTNGYTDEINQKTFLGGLEKLFRDAVERFPTIPKAFLIVHKVNDSCIKTDDIHRAEYPSGEIITFDFFVDCIYKAARKYGIKIIDVNNNSAFDTYNSTLKSIYTGNDGDGLHPNRDGYDKFYVPPIKEWIQNIVIN